MFETLPKLKTNKKTHVITSGAVESIRVLATDSVCTAVVACLSGLATRWNQRRYFGARGTRSSLLSSTCDTIVEKSSWCEWVVRRDRLITFYW